MTATAASTWKFPEAVIVHAITFRRTARPRRDRDGRRRGDVQRPDGEAEARCVALGALRSRYGDLVNLLRRAEFANVMGNDVCQMFLDSGASAADFGVLIHLLRAAAAECAEAESRRLEAIAMSADAANDAAAADFADVCRQRNEAIRHRDELRAHMQAQQRQSE